MLRAFDYTEQALPSMPIQNKKIFREEKRLALQYVMNYPQEKAGEKRCPVCGSEHLKWIFHRWDVDYYICRQCLSIFAPVDQKIVDGYLAMDEMKELRISKTYQKEAEVRRADSWDELLLWFRYRAYRYLGKNTGLSILDFGDRYWGLSNRFKELENGKNYVLIDSILTTGQQADCINGQADIALYINQLQHETEPVRSLKKIGSRLSGKGLLFLNTRLGSGFDVMTLKGGLDNVFPYEHVLLPSRKGLELLLDKAGFELLEIVTPGVMDMQYVMDNHERIDEGNLFARYLVEDADSATVMDFQRFLQKAGLSSFAQLVARKKAEE